MMNRTLTLTAALACAALWSAGPAHADPNSDFLGLLSDAGIGYANPGDTTALGRTVCDLLVEPGKSFAATVSEVQNNGIPPQMAAFFAGIAIQTYCPSMLASVADGSVMNQLDVMNQLGGLNSINGLTGLAGSSLLSGLTGFRIPGQ